MSDQLAAEAGLIISQFIMHMQHEDVWLCRLRIGDEADELKPSELLELKEEFLKKLRDS